MMTQRLWINIYRAGHYHRQGKPDHCNIHGGDLFTTESLALENVERGAGYVATVSLDMPVPDGCVVLTNPEGSQPSSLYETKNNPLALLPWHTAPYPTPPILRQSCPMPGVDDASDDIADASYSEWRDNLADKSASQPRQPQRAVLLSAPAPALYSAEHHAAGYPGY